VFNELFSAMDNLDMQPSFMRLLSCAKQATAGTSTPIHSAKDLRAAMNLSPQTLNNWKNERGVSVPGARVAERMFGCRHAWILDGEAPEWIPGREPSGAGIFHDAGGPIVSEALRAVEASTKQVSAFTDEIPGDTKAIRAPLVQWGSLDVSLMKSNREWPAEVFVSFTSVTEKVSDHVKAVTVLESKLPTISPGDRIAIDAKVAPWDDCVVVIKTSGGKQELRRYLSLADGGWEAICPNEPPLDSRRHGLKLIGVVVALNKMNF
jgi:hypothetical protein